MSVICVKTKTSDGGMSVGTEVCVKKEETLDLNIYNHGDNHRHGPEVTIKEEEADHEDYLCKMSGLS